MLPRLLTGIVAASSLASQMAVAGENMWVYAKGTDTRPQHSSEVKVSDVIRMDKNSGSYTFHDIRAEYEYGMTDKLTVAAEVMVFHHDYKLKDCIEPMIETQGGTCNDDGTVDPGKGFKDTQIGGFELSMKYNVLSPYKDPLGLSLGLAYERREKYRLDGSDIDQNSFVGTVYMQKDFMDDQLVTVLNLKAEFERRKSGNVLEEEIAVEVMAGVSYRVAPKWFVGLEFRHQSDYLNPQDKDAIGEDGIDEKGFTENLEASQFDLGNFKVGSQHQRGNYLGPTVHYAEEKWFVTGGVLWQISGGGSEHSYSTHGRNWDEHERMHVGLFYGYAF